MNFLDEIEFYCTEENPTGAILLTGEWGCGKTYFIENDLKEWLKSKAVIVKISLFGMISPTEIHKAVKNAYLESILAEKVHGDVPDLLKKGKLVLNGISGILPDEVTNWAKIDLTEAVPLHNTMKIGDFTKAVLLVFDDLERCNINTADILGIINGYCENLNFHTIIVANQEKIEARSSDKCPTLSYAEIKEKIVQRTITYSPDYHKVVDSVIENIKCGNEGYLNFLKQYAPGIQDLFASDYTFIPDDKGTESKDNIQFYRPHNIRSLKCSLNDFFRVYNLLEMKGLDHLDIWLYNFISYVIAYKADLITEDPYGTLLADTQIQKIFPAFQSSYMLNGVQNWILHGIWDEDEIIREIDRVKKRSEPTKPCDIIKISRICDIDDTTIREGFAEYLNEAYNGNLSPDEYIHMIENSAWARKNKYEFPQPIDWEKVKTGINMKKSEIMDSLPDGQLITSSISDKNKEIFQPSEWEAYEIIRNSFSRDKIMFLKNKQLYITSIKSSPYEGLMKIQNKRFDRFDLEMADATFSIFKNASTATKRLFYISFSKIWSLHINSSDIIKDSTRSGLEELKKKLQDYIDEQANVKRTFAIIHTEAFVAKLDELLRQLESSN